jgi:hypothetical protein
MIFIFVYDSVKMQKITIIFGIIIMISLLNIINAERRKRVSDKIKIKYLLLYIFVLVFK